MVEAGEPVQSFDQYSREQLEIYARELAEHVQRERELRQDLEQRVRELEALNRLFRQHLEERFQVVDAHRETAEELQRLAGQMIALADRFAAQPMPERNEPPADHKAYQEEP